MLGFATIGISFFYLAWRYNIFFVTDTQIDTRGLIYPRALKQLFAGVYIAELSMIGLFATSVAIGPLVLMIIFLIFSILLNLTINNAIDPLLYNLPRTLAEEEAARSRRESAENGEKDAENVSNGTSSNTASKKKLGLFAKFFKPWEYCDYETMRKLVPHDGIDVYNAYADEVERDAYYPPSVTSATPLLWIPEDPLGISKQEVHDTGKVIPITDEGCKLTDKNKLEWDTETVRPPVWEEKIYY